MAGEVGKAAAVAVKVARGAVATKGSHNTGAAKMEVEAAMAGARVVVSMVDGWVAAGRTADAQADWASRGDESR